jgi:eukaryotic-like serine/threonine-protein kinase
MSAGTTKSGTTHRPERRSGAGRSRLLRAGAAYPGAHGASAARGSLGAGATVVLVVAFCLSLAAIAGAEATLSGLWSRRIGRSVTVAPAVAPGRVFAVSTDGRVQCYRMADGRRFWGRRLKDPGEAAPAWSPSGKGGRLFVSSGEKGTVLLALEGLRGRTAWNRDLGSAITALAADDSVVVALARKGTLAAWRASDGTALWTRSLRGWDPPSFLLCQGRVFAAMRRDSLLALDAGNGTATWCAAPGGIFASGPVLVDGLLALTDVDGSTVWIESGAGRVQGRTARSGWQLQAGAASGRGLVTVSSGGRVEWAGPEPEPRDWSTPLDIAVVASPLVRRGMVLVGAVSGRLSALDAWDGRLLWSFQSPGGFRVGPCAVGDTLILADTRGHLHVYLDGAGRN